MKVILELTQEELELLKELVTEDINALTSSLNAIGRWTKRLETRVGLLDDLQLKLEAAK